jgi:hypothetical protein
MPRILGFMLAAGLAGVALEARAEPTVLSQLYGQGVHQFFSGDYSAARQSLSEAVDNNSRDPRVYYYRALVNVRLGDQSAAQRDFQLAASLEQTPAGRQYAVSRALQRIQGRDRQTLERYRAAAKMAAYREAEARRQARYGRERQDNLEDLRQQSLAAPEAPAVRQVPQDFRPPVEETPALLDQEPTADAGAAAAPSDVAAPAESNADVPADTAAPAAPAEGSVPAPVFGSIIRRAIGNTLAPTGASAGRGAPQDVVPGLDAGAPAAPPADDSELFAPDAGPADAAAPTDDPFAEPAPAADAASPAGSRPSAAAPAEAPGELPELPAAEPAVSPDEPAAESFDSLESPPDDSLDQPPAAEPPADGDSLDDAAAPADEPADPAAEDAGDAPAEAEGDSLDEPPTDMPAEEEGDSLDEPPPEAPPADEAEPPPEAAP